LESRLNITMDEKRLKDMRVEELEREVRALADQKQLAEGACGGLRERVGELERALARKEEEGKEGQMAVARLVGQADQDRATIDELQTARRALAGGEGRAGVVIERGCEGERGAGTGADEEGQRAEGGRAEAVGRVGRWRGTAGGTE
jgi:chromosome segregation ATPase